MTGPLVSIMTITYNHAPYIGQAIEGVLQQETNFPFELIIGEDCSKDGTRESVLEYQRKYPEIIRVITSANNVGMKKNGYRTLKACRGKYVAFCEGDDFWHRPDKLQKQVDFMESHPECGLVHSSYDVYDVGSKKLIKDCFKYRKFEMPINPKLLDIINDCRISFRIQTCTAMVRRNQLEQIVESDPYLYHGGHFLMGDTQLWAEVAVISEIGFIPESMATYRLLQESASRSKDLRKSCLFEMSDSEMKMYLCDKYKLNGNIRRNREWAWCNSALRLAYHDRNAALALEVRKKKPQFTWKEWLWYYGARNRMAYYACKVSAFFRNLIIKEEIKY